MSDVVIRAEGLGKRYLIGHQAENGRYVALRDVLMQNARGLWRKTRDLAQGKPIVQGDTLEEIWALRDVDFEIRRGEAVGIIGRNGAGKSTLLKILSRITEPSTGRVTIKGRVASLLEVGTGFHPELTGRENIYLNGAILGMTRAEIKRKFDEIVAFAEVEKFFDTPVKRYSSGMYVRLAFAVAAHLEPEILVVDEVLAVGDVAFQKKCLNKMDDVAGQGRTVLFVSHNMQAIRSLCPRGILLHHGTIHSDATVGEALHRYQENVRAIQVDETTSVRNLRHRRGSGAVRYMAIQILDASGETQHTFRMGDTICFNLAYRVFEPVSGLAINIALKSGLTSEFITSVGYSLSERTLRPGETGSVLIDLPEVIIRPGDYSLYFWLGKLDIPYDVVDDLTGPLTILESDDHNQFDFLPSKPIGYFSMPSRIRHLVEKEDAQAGY